MLAIVVAMFAVLWLPYRAYVVYNSFARERYENLWFLLVCRLMVYVNSAVNPLLYNAMSVKFRRAFIQLLSCGKRGVVTRPPPPLYYAQASHATAGVTYGTGFQLHRGDTRGTQRNNLHAKDVSISLAHSPGGRKASNVSDISRSPGGRKASIVSDISRCPGERKASTVSSKTVSENTESSC